MDQEKSKLIGRESREIYFKNLKGGRLHRREHVEPMKWEYRKMLLIDRFVDLRR